MPETGEAPMVIMSGKNARLDIAGRYIRLPFHAIRDWGLRRRVHVVFSIG